MFHWITLIFFSFFSFFFYKTLYTVKRNIYRPFDCPQESLEKENPKLPLLKYEGYEPVVIFKHNMPLMKKYEQCIEVTIGQVGGVYFFEIFLFFF